MILAKWDFEKLLREVAEHRNWAPQQLWDMTPHELVAVFCVGARDKTIRPDDRLAMLKEYHDRQATAGKRPKAPSWLLPHLRKKG